MWVLDKSTMTAELADDDSWQIKIITLLFFIGVVVKQIDVLRTFA